MNVSGIPAALPARDLSRAEAFYFVKVGLEAVESSFLNASDGPVGVVVGDTVNQIVLYPAEAKSSGRSTTPPRRTRRTALLRHLMVAGERGSRISEGNLVGVVSALAG